MAARAFSGQFTAASHRRGTGPQLGRGSSWRRRLAPFSALALMGALGCSPGSSARSAPVVTAPAEGEAAPSEQEQGEMPDLPTSPELTAPGDEAAIFDPDDMGTTEVPPPPPRRRGLLERQVSCEGEGTTTVSGTVYVPSGALPVYNAIVYVPDGELQPLPDGVSCSCEISGEPIATALTDSAGRFVLPNVPVGNDIPIVVQVGDWRREFNIGSVAACTDNAVPDQTLRLPSRQAEGDLPRIAVATGGSDALECLIRKLGIDQSEFTTPIGNGRVQLFAGYGGTDEYGDAWGDGLVFPPAEALWWDLPSLQPFDLVLLSCDGTSDLNNKGPESRQAMHDYLNLGGRVFASHFQEVWLRHGPGALPELATYVDEDEDDDLGDVSAQVVTSFPKGQALAEWLVNVGVSPTLGAVAIEGAQHTIAQENPSYAQRWIATEEPASVQYISANAPLGVPEDQQCGRVVLSDIHVSPGASDGTDDRSAPTFEYPEGCVTEGFSPQEAVLAFMLFDISSCIVPDNQAPAAPPPIIR